MGNFFKYLEDIENSKTVETKKPTDQVNKVKILKLNAEIRTIDGAKLIIEKLEEWIAKQSPIQEKKVENKKFKIKPKKIIKSPIIETTSHAIEILDGIVEKPITSNENINNQITDISSVTGHASALL